MNRYSLPNIETTLEYKCRNGFPGYAVRNDLVRPEGSRTVEMWEVYIERVNNVLLIWEGDMIADAYHINEAHIAFDKLQKQARRTAARLLRYARKCSPPVARSVEFQNDTNL